MANDSTIDALQERLKIAQTRLARAEGAQESIKAQWLKDFGTEDPLVVEAKLQEFETELRELTKSYDELLAETRLILDKAEI